MTSMMKCDVCGASEVEMVSLSGRQSDGQEVDIDVCADGCRRLEETA